jgi:Tat protein translocase TatB subunit
MNFLGMGPMEITVILIVALMIFGPGKLPEMASQAGKMMRDFKKMTADLSDEFEKTAGIDEIKKTVQKEMAGIQSEVSGVTSGVKKELTGAQNTVKNATSTAKKPTTTPAKSTSTAAKSTTTAKSTTSTTAKSGSAAKPASTTASKTTAAAPVKLAPAKASKADPLADMSFLNDMFEAEPVKTVAQTAKPAAPAVQEPAPEVGDALARARARRQQAYSRAQV